MPSSASSDPFEPPITRDFSSRKAALAFLDDHALHCVQWMEKGVKMSAIYWSGRRHIQREDKKINWSKVNG